MTKYTHYEYCEMLLILGACNNPACIAAREQGNMGYVVLADVIQTLMCFDDCKCTVTGQ